MKMSASQEQPPTTMLSISAVRNVNMLWPVFALLWLRTVDAFNIDSEYPLAFKGSPASYFGYSVSLLDNSRGSWLVAGAPRANSTYVGHEGIVEPGVIYRCQIPDGPCTSILLDATGNGENVIITKDLKYRDLKDGMWLGVSVDTTSVANGRLVACAHRWRNVFFRGHHLMNGVCYAMDGEFDERSLQKLMPLVSASQQILKSEEYKYAVGQSGTSAQFVKDSDSLLLGAPGIYDWKGSVAMLTRADSGIISKRSTDLQSYATRLVPEPGNLVDYGSYLGYSVTSGTFHENGDIRYVIGAPRHKYRGTVFIINIVDDRSEGRFESKIEKHGEQMGEYFGASVLATDVTNDGLDDLLVGAPFHSWDMDEGKVYVYINKGSARLLVHNGLTGSKVRGARFGSSMAIIGDVNMDGYQDVAIGAPFENDKGAVYIYHGSADGLKPQFQQRIEASQASTSARGFGISVSRGLDVDGNNYPDLAVGAFHSDEAFIFRSRPLVYLKGSLTSDQYQINMDRKDCDVEGTPITCYKVEACVTYTGKFVPPTLLVRVGLEMDTLKMNRTNTSRVIIWTPNEGDKRKTSLTTQQTLQAGQSWCKKYDIHAPIRPRDIMTPILMKLTYELIPESRPAGFCATCPTIDKSQPNMVIAQMRYLKHCGDDDKCDSDLKLVAQLKDFGPNDVIVIGARNKLVLHVEVSNSMEPAYATIVSLNVPLWMDIDQRPPSCEFTLGNRNTLQCMLANPLKTNNTATLQLNLNLQRMPVKDGQLLLNISTSSDSNEDFDRLKDNRVILTVPVKVVADVTVLGAAINEQIFYDHDAKGQVEERATANFSHIYEVVNIGPSPVTVVTVHLHYPTRSRDGQTHFLDITGIDKKDGSRGAVFGTCEGKLGSKNRHATDAKPDESGESLIPIDDSTSKPTVRRRRQVQERQGTSQSGQTNETSISPVRQENMAIDCKNMLCETISCTVGPFDKGVSVAVIIHATVHVHYLRNLMGNRDVADIFTMARIFINSSTNIQPVDHKPDMATVSSELKPGGPPLPKQLAPWIIPVSIIGGFLLLCLIVYGMVKAGFFRRQTKEEMERLMHGGEQNTALVSKTTDDNMAGSS